MHGDHLLPLGKVNDQLWPFAPAVDYLIKDENSHIVDIYVDTWESIRTAYRNKNRDNLLYYAANASGNPPNIAKENFGWQLKNQFLIQKQVLVLIEPMISRKGFIRHLNLVLNQAKLFLKKILRRH